MSILFFYKKFLEKIVTHDTGCLGVMGLNRVGVGSGWVLNNNNDNDIARKENVIRRISGPLFSFVQLSVYLHKPMKYSIFR